MQAVTVWTDGSTYPQNPGRGGWAALLIFQDKACLLAGHIKHATINVAETQAVLEALRRLHRPCLVHIFTDSQYVANGLKALSQGRLLTSNRDLWKALRVEYKRHGAVKVDMVKAHKANTQKYNRLCDRYAYMAALGMIDHEDRLAELREIDNESTSRPSSTEKANFKSIPARASVAGSVP